MNNTLTTVTSTENMSGKEIKSISDLIPELDEVPDCWEDLAEILSEPEVPEPVEKEVVTVVTMETVVTKVTKTPPSTKARSQKPRKVSTPRRRKMKGRTMTLREYHAECERKEMEAQEEAERIAKQNAPSAKTLRNRRKRERAKAKKATQKTEEEKTWSKVVSKPATPRAKIRIPDRKSLPKKTTKEQKPTTTTGEQKGRFVNTTLILKNLPYERVTTRDLRHAFKDCGPIKFINILKKEDGTCKGIAFIRFERREGSEKGLDLDGFWYENRKIYVEYARDKRERVYR